MCFNAKFATYSERTGTSTRETVRWQHHLGIANFIELYIPLASGWRLYDNSAVGKLALVAQGSNTGRVEVFRDGLWQQINEDAGRQQSTE